MEVSTGQIEIFVVFLTLLAAFLYETSGAFRYYLKFLLYYGIVIMQSFVMIPIFCFRPKNVRNLVWTGFITKPISFLIGMKWELRGADILSRDESFIIVANHQSSLDILGMLDFWHIMDKCTVIAKMELMYAVPFSIAAWLCGLVFIDRKNPDKAKATMNDAVEVLKQKRIKLWVFPEGTRRSTREIHPFKKGAFHVAIASQLPILPVVYSSYTPFMDKKAKKFDPGRIIVTTLPPIPTIGLTNADIDDLMERTRNAMIKTYFETTKEVEAQMQLDNINKMTQNQNSKAASLDISSALRRINLR